MRVATFEETGEMESLGEQALRRWPDEIPAAEQQERGRSPRGTSTAARLKGTGAHSLAHDLSYADHHLDERLDNRTGSRSAASDEDQDHDMLSDRAQGGDADEAHDLDLRRLSHAAERGALMGTRRLDKVRAEWREFTRRLDGSAMTTTELRRLRLELRRREIFLFVLGGFLLVMGALYGALVFSSPQLLGNPRSEFGCSMFGGSWAATQSGKSYCIFWAQ